MALLKHFICNHDWKIVNEYHESDYLGPIEGWICIKQSYLLYCKKCKRKKWFTEEETKTIMNIQKIDNQGK